MREYQVSSCLPCEGAFSRCNRQACCDIPLTYRCSPSLSVILQPAMQAEKIVIPGTATASSMRQKKRLSIRELLRPHKTALLFGFLAVAGESAANLLGPWPLKVVLDDVLRNRESHATVTRWMHALVGSGKVAVLEFACAAVMAIAILDAVS